MSTIVAPNKILPNSPLSTGQLLGGWRVDFFLLQEAGNVRDGSLRLLRMQICLGKQGLELIFSRILGPGVQNVDCGVGIAF